MFSILFILAGSLLNTTAKAPPEPRLRPEANKNLFTTVLTSTILGTATLNLPATILTTMGPSPALNSASVKPSYTATQLYAYRENSPIHLLPIQARGLFFQLGGRPTTACPSNIEDCPPGDITGMNQCELSVIVAGGQQVYLKPDGSLRFTATHSVAMSPGSVPCPLNFTVLDGDISEVSVEGFGATALMACPMLNSTRVPEQWQVYANLLNASVPLLHANSSSCLEFETIGVEFHIGDSPAAYGYV